jgi:squalene-hopene/tetraprenyl-beta-curcumene cyclase
MKRFLLPLLGLVAATRALLAADDDLAIARRALPFLEREGTAWMEERKCVSCHQIPSMLWSFQRASEVRLLEPADATKLTEWTAWAHDWRHWMSPETVTNEQTHADKDLEMLAHLVLARSADTAANAEPIARWRQHLLRNQQPDGSWKAGGQYPLARRPAREIQEVTTMWVLLAVGSTKPKREPPSESSARALAWLAQSSPGKSVEWHALNLLLKRHFGPAAELAPALDSLLKLQNPDGGWPWLTGEPSDALGTGYALYALAPAPTPASTAAIQHATTFLAGSQTAEGTWPCPSTRAKDQRKVRETTTYWGTAWAVIGLLESRAAYAPKIAAPD